MVSKQTLTILSNIIGQDLTPLSDIQAAIGAAIASDDKSDQLFVSQHWPNLAAFLSSKRGQGCIQLLVNEWKESVQGQQ